MPDGKQPPGQGWAGLTEGAEPTSQRAGNQTDGETDRRRDGETGRQLDGDREPRTETGQGQTLWLAKKELLDPCSWPLPFVLALLFILYMHIYIYIYVVCVCVCVLPCAISLVGVGCQLPDGVLGAVKYSFVFFCLSITNVLFPFAITSFSCLSCSAPAPAPLLLHSLCCAIPMETALPAGFLAGKSNFLLLVK